jgi:sugar phosphate isomerase/epimerase
MKCGADDFASCVAATEGAGFKSISVWPFHTDAIGMDRAEALLTDAGIKVRAVEAATSWGDAPPAAIRDEAAPLLAFAGRFGADILVAVKLDLGLESIRRAAEGFSTLCGLAADQGIGVCLEFLPWTGIPDISTAWQIVEQSGAPNGGILLDTWHWTRQPGGPNPDVLRQVPGERIHYVQVSDTSPAADSELIVETMTDRRLPGTGATDIPAVFATLNDIGARPFVAAEVFSSSLAATGPWEMAKAVRAACDATLG